MESFILTTTPVFKIENKSIKILLHLLIGGVCAQATTVVEIGGQFVGVGSVVSPVGSWDRIQVLRDKRQVPFPTEPSKPKEIYLCSKNYFIIIFVCFSFTCMYVCHNCDVALEVTRRCWIP